MFPSTVVDSGKSFVTLSYTPMMSSVERVLCDFGPGVFSKVTIANFSESTVTCQVPRTGYSNVSVAIQYNGITSELFHGISLVRALKIESLIPSRGVQGGGSSITIHGSGIGIQGIGCRITGKFVPARILALDLIVCDMGRVAPGKVSIAIGSDLISWSEESIDFEVLDPLELHSIEPQSGHIRGNTPVSVSCLLYTSPSPRDS